MFSLDDKKGKSNATNVGNEENQTNGKSNEAISRRKVLATIGLGGVMLAGSVLGPRLASADNGSSNDKDAKDNKDSKDGDRVLQVNNVAALKSLPMGQLKDGQHVFVSGYNKSGDGGG